MSPSIRDVFPEQEDGEDLNQEDEDPCQGCQQLMMTDDNYCK